MSKKPTFPEPGCWGCSHHMVQGKFPCETRYCMGTGRKRGKRFKKSDPQCKAPRWCPKRLSPKICRVYRLSGENERLMEQMRRAEMRPQKHKNYSVFWHRYEQEPRYESPIFLTAKQFYEQANRERADNILEDFQTEYGDVIEIDDGLQPYYFYCFDFMKLLPTMGLKIFRQT